jgi:hypothetical protein
MARYFKGYDDDARRRILEQYRKGANTRSLPSLTDSVFEDDQGYNQELRYNSDGDLVAKYYNPKGARPLLDPQGQQVTNDNNEAQFDFQVDFQSVSPDSARPAKLTVVPTTSTNFKRPYTVAAGWERYPRQSGAGLDNLGTLTTLFRDGTLWNYYNVDRSFWIKFKDAISKGEYINKNSPNPQLTLNYINGPADTSQVSESTRALIYTVARTSQYRFASKRKYTYTNKLTGEKREVGPGAVKKSAKLGRNTATANRPKKP